jgi:hypothetical protein
MTERSVTDAAVVGAARKLLETFVGMYQGLDAGEQDSVHRAREKAQRRIEIGPTAEDPFEVAADVEAALPGDPGAGRVAQSWRDELEGLGVPDYESLDAEIIGRLESAADAFVTTHDRDGTVVRGLRPADLAEVISGPSVTQISDRIHALKQDARVVESEAYPDLWMVPSDE